MASVGLELTVTIADLPATRLLVWDLGEFLLLLRERDPDMAARLERILERWTAGLADEAPPSSS